MSSFKLKNTQQKEFFLFPVGEWIILLLFRNITENWMYTYISCVFVNELILWLSLQLIKCKNLCFQNWRFSGWGQHLWWETWCRQETRGNWCGFWLWQRSKNEWICKSRRVREITYQHNHNMFWFSDTYSKMHNKILKILGHCISFLDFSLVIQSL